ncbi:3-hydroxyacyl-CoA dehydrogenase PaaC [Halomonas sp. ISL-60]|uniref:3-hydroxyacyl-CoA dehydrogenase PaaH n=1 Tax=Halomonas sp. ISL-56 TaxID=2819149 RepID=UPI001BE94145|nr:3-hydroxyacyl-CoA dehydrogenase PaaH [Halomonas sp. ISL-56]MBT2772261.1 3-hydroxyacyl-CoA dehydrogenase PaaC [Halomonas sp. ISL-60]MBT2802980.1 3-hydroxyacyl-CoA dehydrogenase PaaC [Halomonas sp. ISL-56]
MPALPSTATIGVIGAGAMGAGIAQVAAQAGHSVILYDNQPGTAKAGIDNIRRQLEKRVAKGKMPQGDVDTIIARLQPADAIDALADSRLIIEAIVENLEIKRQVFAQLEALCPPGTLLASNTSSLSITSIAANLEYPERMAGLHFFNPAPVMKLVEVVSGLATTSEVAETLFDTASAWGKVAVHASSTPGFIVNRVARPFYAEGLRLLQEVASDAATLDALMRQAGGFRMGPFELMDLIGHDVNYAVTRSVFDAYYGDTRFKPSLVQQALVEAGRLGRKSGQGFFDYPPEGERANTVTAQPKFAAPANAELPALVVQGANSTIAPLLERAQEAGLDVVYRESLHQDGTSRLYLGDLVLALSDGRCAAERAVNEGLEALVLFDLCLDYRSASAIGLAASHTASPEARQLATAFFQRLGMDVAWLTDTPGLVVLRTVAMLANEAADAVLQGVCSAQDGDLAMQAGVNYPRGLLAWADSLGLPFVHRTLTHLQQSYGEERYRSSFLLRRKALSEESFHE